MAQAAAAKKRPTPPRGSLSRAQRVKIRGWRSDLGHAIWDLNESPLAHELRRKYDLEQPWEPEEMMQLSQGIETVVLVALEIRKELAQFIKRDGRLRKDARPMAKQYLDRLKGALEGIWLGVGYLRRLTPENLEMFIEEFLGKDFELAEMLFFGFCPIMLEATHGLPAGKRQQQAEAAVFARRQLKGAEMREEIKQLKARESVARKLDLKGMASEAAKSRRELEKLLRSPTDESRTIAEKGGCYNNGLKAFRAAVMQMFYTLQARDVRRIKLDDQDSDNWHSWQRDIGEPPQTLVDQMQEIADDEGRVLHVFDKENALVYVATPQWYVGEDPESLAQRAALKQSKPRRKDWSFDYARKTPSDAAELFRTLTPEERKRVTRVLERTRDPQTGEPLKEYTLEQVASIANVPFLSEEEAAFHRKSAAQYGRNPEMKAEADRVTEIAQDHGLITALWSTDLD